MTSKKINDTTIEITKTEPAKDVVNTYERKFIEDQIIAITKQRDDMIALKEAELKEVQDILAEMDKLGIKINTEVVE